MSFCSRLPPPEQFLSCICKTVLHGNCSGSFLGKRRKRCSTGSCSSWRQLVSALSTTLRGTAVCSEPQVVGSFENAILDDVSVLCSGLGSRSWPRWRVKIRGSLPCCFNRIEGALIEGQQSTCRSSGPCLCFKFTCCELTMQNYLVADKGMALA